MSPREALVAYERSRYSSQLSFVEGWLGPLRAGDVQADAMAFRRAWDERRSDAQMMQAQLRADLERDATRLSAAARGNSRSAVPAEGVAPLPSHALFAIEQAHHIASAVHRFAAQASEAESSSSLRDATERARRWAQRLRWELLDTPCAGASPALALGTQALALRADGGSLNALRTLAQTHAVAVQALLLRLRKPPLSPDMDGTASP